MPINEFIEKFQSQLENTEVTIAPETEYSKESYWDSLTAMVIKVMIEDEYGVDMEPEQITALGNINALYSFVVEKKQ
ncbi:MAG: acyl carrier protein [Chryseobacterium sp.]|jgi:acyl carrier protein|uniref:acyl carrier protein n=1 Tax=Chryseobacterium sp. TaxID=1871047 RepID=UPI00282AC280|nr:acyl carrier protein [Chryseobacterium sp.]MDR2236280.1 acyl carrier protein [Chryseobacterium sp.]